MTPKERAAMQQALEALEHLQTWPMAKEAITALREALEHPVSQDFETWWEREGQEFLYALNTTTDDDIKLVAEFAWKNGAYKVEQPVSQEPFGWYSNKGGFNECGEGRPLYTAPQPVREVELTDDEIGALTALDWSSHVETPLLADFARAVIAAYKEKNK